MTLKQKFLKLYHKFTISDEWEGSLEAAAEKIADDFAIGFAEWYLKVSEKYDSHLKLQNDSKQLLEIYKKEKGL